MTREKIEKIIEQLENIKSRPAVFLGKAGEVDAAIHFFHGYHAALFISEANQKPSLDIYRDVREKRGWEWNATSVANEMRGKSFSDDEIVQELITIEIEAWKFVLKSED